MYEKLEKKYCRPRYGLYLTYDEAEEACNSDPVCKYIYDTECNKLNKFNLCDDNADVKSSTASCIYKKTSSEKLGKHVEYLWGLWSLRWCYENWFGATYEIYFTFQER